jgi:gamma-glutamyltranspeptidase
VGEQGPRLAVAAPHPAGVEAARAVAGRGGNALDAAIAAAAALTVTYPHQCSVGGDLVALVRAPGGAARAVLSIGAAPHRLDVAALRAAGATMPPGGPQTVTVPGVVAGWAAVHGLGARLGLDALLAPAIERAEHGVPVSPGLARAAKARADVIRRDPGLAALLLDGERPREVSELLHQPALAATLAAIGKDWRSFYTGDVASRLAAGLARLGSPLTATDFAHHEAEIAEPLRRRALGTSWAVAPPPTQGASLLAVLTSEGSQLATARRAEQRRDALLGDPRRGPVDLDALLLESNRDTEDLGTGPKPAGDTVAVTVVGADGTAVSLIQSVFQSFGSGLLEPDTGIVLHNRGSAFSLDPTHPGVARPGARPPHTLCPAIAEHDDSVAALGCQGGRAQAWILSQIAADVLDCTDPAGLLARARWVIGSRDLGHPVPTLVLEPGVPGAAGLERIAAEIGLAVVHESGLHDDAGHVQVARLVGGRLAAASDVRADGAAALL